MEEVISLYTEEEADPGRPLIRFDETSKQLVRETRLPLPPRPGALERFDYEYQREGTANVYMMVAPRLAGGRSTSPLGARACTLPCRCGRWLMKLHTGTTIRVVLDNLNTHNPARLHEAFPPVEAKRILDRLEFHYTPKHGRWLNMAEIELSILSRQYLKPCVPDADTLQNEIDNWQDARDADKAKIHWVFSLSDARATLPFTFSMTRH